MISVANMSETEFELLVRAYLQRHAPKGEHLYVSLNGTMNTDGICNKFTWSVSTFSPEVSVKGEKVAICLSEHTRRAQIDKANTLQQIEYEEPVMELPPMDKELPF